jgi:quinol monooxygenase YgiN
MTRSEPLIFLNTTAIKDGQLDAWVAYFEAFAEHIEANEPRLLHFAMYVNEDGTEETIVQVHPDADSMQHHLQVLAEHEHAAADYLDFTRSWTHVYGAPPPELVTSIRRFGNPVTVSTPAGGFDRLPVRPHQVPSG